MLVLRAMQFSSTTFNRPPPLELHAYGTPSSQIAISRKQRVCAGHYSSMLQQAPACKDKGIKELSSERTLFASPSSSPSSPKLTQWTLPLANILSVAGFAILMRRREGYPCSGKHYTSSMVQLISEKLIVFRLVLDTIQIGVPDHLKKQYVQSLSEGRRGFIALIVTIVCLACPSVIVTDDKAIHTSNNVALAQSIGQIRQAALLLERFGESASTKVLDKVMTVISGQTVVRFNVISYYLRIWLKTRKFCSMRAKAWLQEICIHSIQLDMPMTCNPRMPYDTSARVQKRIEKESNRKRAGEKGYESFFGYNMDGNKEEGSSSEDRQPIPTAHEIGESSGQAEKALQVVTAVTMFKQLMENPRFLEFIQSSSIAH
ncbi:hypothetical protein L7F22_034079 [Adiantum nelumboides]|nr:hypothetical protein [Adiantum nelumboides]